MNRPKPLLDPLALLGDQLFRLARQISDPIPYFQPPLEPTGIAVSIIIMVRFPAGLTVSVDARLSRRPQPATVRILRSLVRATPAKLLRVCQFSPCSSLSTYLSGSIWCRPRPIFEYCFEFNCAQIFFI